MGVKTEAGRLMGMAGKALMPARLAWDQEGRGSGLLLVPLLTIIKSF